MKNFLLIALLLLLTACSDQNEKTNVESDEGPPEQQQPAEQNEPVVKDDDEAQKEQSYEEDPFLEEVNYDIVSILSEMENRIKERGRYAGSIDKQFNFIGQKGTTSTNYSLNYEMILDEVNGKPANTYHSILRGTTVDAPNSEHYWERYFFPGKAAYDVYYDNYVNYFDLEGELQLEGVSFYLSAVEALNMLQQVADAAHISTHNAEQGYMEIAFSLNPDEHYDFLSLFLIDPVDRESGMFNDYMADFAEGETAQIYLMINTIDLLPNIYSNWFKMYSEDIETTIEMNTHFSFHWDTPVEDIVVPEEVVNAGN